MKTFRASLVAITLGLTATSAVSATAMGDTTRLEDVIVPELFTGYSQQYTTEKTNLISSGVMVRDAELDAFLATGGFAFNSPSFNDLENTEDNVSSDDPTVKSTPDKIGTIKETQIRLSRNKSWSSMDLSNALAGPDPMDAIANLTGGYWSRRLQVIFNNTWQGVFASDDANFGAGSGNVAEDYGSGELTHSELRVATGGATLEAFDASIDGFDETSIIKTGMTMDDSYGELGIMKVHPVVYQKMLTNDMITFVPFSDQAKPIPVYQGYQVVMDKAVKHHTTGAFRGVYETWLFAPGCTRMGLSSPKVPTAVTRNEDAGNGGGEEILTNRLELIVHPVGYAWNDILSPSGGPSNATLADATKWTRAFTERNQIKAARLLTREHG